MKDSRPRTLPLISPGMKAMVNNNCYVICFCCELSIKKSEIIGPIVIVNNQLGAIRSIGQSIGRNTWNRLWKRERNSGK